MVNEADNLTLKQLALLRDDVAAMKGELNQKIDAVDHKVGSIAQTLVAVQRDVNGLKREIGRFTDTVETLGIATAAHTHRLDEINKRLGIGIPAN